MADDLDLVANADEEFMVNDGMTEMVRDRSFGNKAVSRAGGTPGSDNLPASKLTNLACLASDGDVWT
jgi:hypothetical protein